MMSDICITTSISDLLRWCDSPSSCKQVFFFFFPASSQYHTSSHFAFSQLSGRAVTFLGCISLSLQNSPRAAPGSWSWRSESPNQRCLTQLSTPLCGMFCRNSKAEVKSPSHGVPKIFALALVSCSTKVTWKIPSITSFCNYLCEFTCKIIIETFLASSHL